MNFAGGQGKMVVGESPGILLVVGEKWYVSCELCDCCVFIVALCDV